MSQSKDIQDKIANNATKPAKVAGEAGSVEQHNLKDQIEAARFLASQTAVNKKNRGLRFSRINPPGANE